MGTPRPRNALHTIYKVGCEKVLHNIVHDGWVCCDAFADIGVHVEKVEEAYGSQEVVLRQGGVVKSRFVAGLVFDKSVEIL